MKFLSEPWCAHVLDLAEPHDAGFRDGAIELDVSDTPDGRVYVVANFTDGRLATLEPGRSDDEDKIILKASWADAKKMTSGELDASVLFMRGTLKTEGPTGLLLELLSALQSQKVADQLPELAAQTDFS